MIARHHTSLFSHSHSNLSPPPTHLSPFQPMPYLLNPASVTALNAKALPRQMIKVSSQFTLQCIDLMFPNLPGLSLMLPRTFRIFHSVPPFPAFSLYPPSLSLCVCIPYLQMKIWLTEMFPPSCLHMIHVYFVCFQKNGLTLCNSYKTSRFCFFFILECNYCPSSTSSFKYCFRVNHSLVLIYHTSFVPHHLFICSSLPSWLLCFSACHFPLRGCSEHFHVLFNYENLI